MKNLALCLACNGYLINILYYYYYYFTKQIFVAELQVPGSQPCCALEMGDKNIFKASLPEAAVIR